MVGHSEQEIFEPERVREAGSLHQGQLDNLWQSVFYLHSPVLLPLAPPMSSIRLSSYIVATSGFAFLEKTSPCYKSLPVSSLTAIKHNLPALYLISLGIKVRPNFICSKVLISGLMHYLIYNMHVNRWFLVRIPDEWLSNNGNFKECGRFFCRTYFWSGISFLQITPPQISNFPAHIFNFFHFWKKK